MMMRLADGSAGVGARSMRRKRRKLASAAAIRTLVGSSPAAGAMRPSQTPNAAWRALSGQGTGGANAAPGSLGLGGSEGVMDNCIL